MKVGMLLGIEQRQLVIGGLVVVLLLFPFYAKPQNTDSNYTLINEIEIDAKLITVDNLNQIYALNADNEIIKFNSNGEEVFRFNNNRLGDLTHIDASNPFNLLLYYADFSNILILDRTLNSTVQLNLFELNFTKVSAVGLANDNNVWVFDDLNFQLKKIDRKGAMIAASDNLNFALNKPIRPNFLLEREQKVFLNDPEIGILIFDFFGQFEKVLEFKNLNKFQVIGEQLLYVEQDKLHSFNLKSLLTKSIKLPKKMEENDNILVQKNRLYLIKKGRIEIYRF
ncbi:MAG: hypothetical protein P1U70_21190 [Saprospiraceae bacterium]|jgi:hypothetical protein|nr:hypothetical protein [Saprospiraceae bacterium]